MTKLPSGNLLCTKNSSYLKWYQSFGKGQPRYIPKKDHELAMKLAAKKLYLMQMKELRDELQAVKTYLEKSSKEKGSIRLIEETSPYHNLLRDYFQTYPDKTDYFLTENYKTNPNHQENLIYRTYQGSMVRSKSEVLIANTLFTNKIPYRYECGLTLEGITMYPDFTILHPRSKEIFYWEHFGMMHKAEYRDAAFNKQKLYAQNGIIPTINLITTYETLENPIDSSKLQKIVEDYFLS